MPGRIPHDMMAMYCGKRAINSVRGPRRSARLSPRARPPTVFADTNDWIRVAPVHTPVLSPMEKHAVSRRLIAALLVVTRRRRLDDTKRSTVAFRAAYRHAITEGLIDIHGKYAVPDTLLDVVCRVATTTLTTFGHRASVKFVVDIMADGNKSNDIRLMHYWDYGTMRVACRVIKAHIPKGYLLSDH